MKKVCVFYPLLFAVFPLISFFNHNINELELSVIYIPFITIFFSSLFLFKVISLIMKNEHKAAVTTTIIFFLFFSYGHFNNTLEKGYFFKNQQFVQLNYLMPLFLLILIFCVFFIVKSRSNFLKVTKILNIISATLIITLVLNIAYFEFTQRSWYAQSRKQVSKTTPSDSSIDKKSLPDIYYLIAERYPSSKSFNKFYNFDNSDLTSFLEQKDFYIAKDSKSNYLITELSLASSLNMDYLDELIKYVDRETSDRMPLWRLIEENKIVPYLKNKGYKYIHIGSNWAPTIKNHLADVSYIYKNTLLISEFSAKFYETTMAYPFIKMFNITKDLEYRNAHRILTLNQIDNLEKLSKLEGPKFVFAHLFLTHSPYVFDRNGNYVTEQEENGKSKKENYLNQLAFANNKYKHLIETILANSKKDPIIIIQADEGTYFDRLWKDHYYFDLRQATGDELREKSCILNAYRLPGENKNKLYPSISPVNTFRLIFNLYFGENFPLLPDLTYAHESYQRPYKLFDVTSLVQ